MRVVVCDHPLISHKLSVLRDAQTPAPVFRALIAELTTLVAVEATRDIVCEPIAVTTPVASLQGQRVAHPRPIAVPILRAGLGMLDAFRAVVPVVDTGFIGLKRNEVTLAPETYMTRFPQETTGRRIFLLDPMLATGGSLIAAIHSCIDAGATSVTALCLVSSPEGVAAVSESAFSIPVSLFVAVIDEGLNGDGYIVPGLGDAGDRMFGVA